MRVTSLVKGGDDKTGVGCHVPPLIKRMQKASAQVAHGSAGATALNESQKILSSHL
jgi:hypothetical protein